MGRPPSGAEVACSMAGWSGDLNVERPFGHDPARGTDEAEIGRALRSLLLPTTRNDLGLRRARGMTEVELKAGPPEKRPGSRR